MFQNGVPTRAAYQRLLASDAFQSIEQAADCFSMQHEDLLLRYKWTKDTFHQWSRQWEYPYVYFSLKKYLSKMMEPKAVLLDAGSGVTFFPFFLTENLPIKRVVCCDSDKGFSAFFKSINEHKKGDGRVVFNEGDLLRLPYQDGAFDAVYCISVLEHTDRHEAILDELCRVLRKRGLLIVSFDIGLDGVSRVPLCEANRILHSLNRCLFGDHNRPLSPDDIESTDILTSRYCKKMNKRLLPWRSPLLSFIKSAIRARKLPNGMGKNLTVFCGSYIKP